MPALLRGDRREGTPSRDVESSFGTCERKVKFGSPHHCVGCGKYLGVTGAFDRTP